MASNQLQNAAAAELRARVQQQLLNHTKNMFLTAAGIGAAVRGGQGMYNLLRRNIKGPKKPPEPSVLQIPVRRSQDKVAHEKQGGLGDMLMDKAQDITSQFTGHGVENVFRHPLTGPATTAALLGGGLAGYKGIDWLLDERRRIAARREEQDARREYEQALLAMAEPAGKMAADSGARDSTLGEDLDQLYELSKQGGVSGPLLSGILAAWPPLMLLGGVPAYKMTRQRQQQHLLDKAIARRQRQQLLNTPIYAVPRPADEDKHDQELLPAS